MLKVKYKNFSPNKFIIELILFLWVEYFFYLNKLEKGEILFISFTLISFWFILSFLTHKFKNADYSSNYFRNINTYLRFYFFYLLVVFAVYLFLSSQISHKQYFLFSSILYVFWSFTLESFVYFYYKPQRSDEVRIDFIKAVSYPEIKEMNGNHSYGFPFLVNKDNQNIADAIIDNFMNNLKEKYFKSENKLFNFISSKLKMDYFFDKNFKIIRSSDPFNVEIIDNDYLSLFINLHKLNDFRRINEYLILVNKKLKNNGVFIGKFEPIRKRYQRFLKKYPKNLARIFYFFDFLWKRVSPKLPVIQKFYFAVTKGRDRAISLAEGLGRLYYSGFEVPYIKENENFIYFIAVKVKEPSKDKNPSYGPLFKMKRVGKNGKLIFVYKLRTMHPYSEYLQDYVIKHFGYNEVGKPVNDFRVTKWGKFIRRLWLDELPQLINVAKGEMKLVGVRPLSQFRFNELPQNVREERIKQKPGCIPPYVSLNMPDARQNIEAEIIYMREKKKHTFRTDIKYFFLAVYNILTNKIRSA